MHSENQSQSGYQDKHGSECIFEARWNAILPRSTSAAFQMDAVHEASVYIGGKDKAPCFVNNVIIPGPGTKCRLQRCHPLVYDEFDRRVAFLAFNSTWK